MSGGIASRQQGKPHGHQAEAATTTATEATGAASALMWIEATVGLSPKTQPLRIWILPSGKALLRLATQGLLHRAASPPREGGPPERADRPTPQGGGRRSREAIDLPPGRPTVCG